MKRVVIETMDLGMASEQDETQVGLFKEDAPVINDQLMERVLERENLQRAFRQVKRNKGSAGIDGMTVDDLTAFVNQHWPKIHQQLLEGNYRPQPVRQVEIPKPKGGVRKLGIPTVLDRLIQQALLQVLQAEWDGSFSHFSYGFRPGKSAHQAIRQSQHFINEGYKWTVDMDLEKFFDRVNHDKLMSLIKRRTQDKRVLKLINSFLKAGALSGDVWVPASEGTPQGGPLSPLLANVLLDEFDKELEARGHRFVRYADDCNIYVKSARSGERVLASVTRYLSNRLKLKVNSEKSAVDRPWNRSFLGLTFSRRRKRKVSDESIQRFKYRVRQITKRTRGRSIEAIYKELSAYMRGWKAYFGIAEVKSPLLDLAKWVRRKLRCYLWKQWGRSGYRQLRKRGIDRWLAWNTAKSAHGPWRLSGSPALRYALPTKYFVAVGIPELVDRK
ncbi:group II intron reverse transcriptase/maturase [Alkalimarinus coralli]|uniref:group II intron reverse transcriptase/maturase n=1 Tax=Alkalimarinus coralli TaxID=2935863 RepID=UPI00202B3C33|nr:group II intron reverse transcriptase/maturase [Alkalimarinus coralli]